LRKSGKSQMGGRILGWVCGRRREGGLWACRVGVLTNFRLDLKGVEKKTPGLQMDGGEKKRCAKQT